MSQLVGRLLLAMLLIPLAAMLYLIVLVIGISGSRYSSSPFSDNMVYLTSGLVTCAFVAAYWYGIWWRVVRWTMARLIMTAVATGGAIVVGVGVGAAVAQVIGRSDVTFSIFVGTVVAPLLWLVATVFIWRETAAERRERLAGAREALVCPTCGYNLTGLKGTRCPECGAEYTLDELMRGQPGKVAGELEGG